MWDLPSSSRAGCRCPQLPLSHAHTSAAPPPSHLSLHTSTPAVDHCSPADTLFSPLFSSDGAVIEKKRRSGASISPSFCRLLFLTSPPPPPRLGFVHTARACSTSRTHARPQFEAHAAETFRPQICLPIKRRALLLPSPSFPLLCTLCVNSQCCWDDSMKVIRLLIIPL